MKQVFFTTIVILFAATLAAQIKVPPVLEQRIAGKNKLYEVMQQVDSFYKTKSVSDNQSMREWKHWKRWEWEMSRYVNSDGKLVNTKKIYSDALQQEQQRQQQQPLTELNESTGQWTSIGPTAFTHINGLYRGLGRINRIAFDPSNSTYMYAGMPNGGLWRSTNSGVSWNPFSTYGPNLGVSGIIVSHADPNDIYVLTGDGDSGGFISDFGYKSYSVGVMKSTNGGSTWTLLTNGLPNTIWAGFSLTQSNTNANVLLAATSSGIYRTDDAGNTWTRVINNFGTDVKFKPGSGLTCYAAGSGWYSYSTDGGITWNEATFNASISGANRIQIGVSPANSNYVYLLCGPAGNGSFKGVWASSNSGQYFSLRTIVPNILGSQPDGSGDSDQSGYDLAIAVSSTNINNIFTGGLCVWRSTTGGFTFSFSTLYKDTASLSIYIHPDIHDLQVNPVNGDLWAASDGGLYRSTDEGLTWVDYSEDIGTAQPYHLAGTESNPDVLYFGSQDNGVKNRLINTQTWRHIQGADGFDVIVDYNNSSRAWWSVNKSLARTSNSGNSTQCINIGCCGTGCGGYEWFGNLAQHVTNPNTIFIGYSDIFKSTNSGDAYETLWGASGSTDIKTCPSNSNRIYSSGGSSYNSLGDLYRTNDGGDNWSKISLNTGFPDFPRPKITCIGVHPTNSNFVWVTFGGTTADIKVFFSSDAGANWSNINSTGLPNVPVNCIAVTPTNDVYIGTEIGVYYRATGGNWTPYYNGLPRSPVTDLVINELAGKIRAATFGRGIWESPLHNNCEVSINFNSTQTGNNFYEAASYITSSAFVTGGNGTNIIYKGGNNVTLLPGFEANTGSQFKAYINGCGLGGIPTANGQLTSGINYTTHRLPMGDSTKFPFGTIELNPAGTEVTYRIYKPGAYTLQVTDDKGYIVQTLTEKQLATGVQAFSFSKPAANGLLYLQLWYNKELVHYQEIQ